MLYNLFFYLLLFYSEIKTVLSHVQLSIFITFKKQHINILKFGFQLMYSDCKISCLKFSYFMLILFY